MMEEEALQGLARQTELGGASGLGYYRGGGAANSTAELPTARRGWEDAEGSDPVQSRTDAQQGAGHRCVTSAVQSRQDRILESADI